MITIIKQDLKELGLENDIEENVFDGNFSTIEETFILSLMKGMQRVFVLWMLKNESLHGYAILKKINECFPKHKIVYSSSLYPTLHSLEENELISSSEQLNGNNKVKVYEITKKGETTLESVKKIASYKLEEKNLISLFIQEMLLDNKHNKGE